jgi:hypothetical protein
MQPGRPRKLNPFGSKFSALYLDPLNQPADICAALGISLKTFYRYETELGLPKLRVAVLNNSGLPIQAARHSFLHYDERYQLNVIRAAAQVMGVRMKLIPCSAWEADLKVRAQEVDMAIACLTKTEERKRELYTSYNYDFYDCPHGVLIGLESAVPKGEKLKVAVMSRSPHFEYADKYLRDEFEIVIYTSEAGLYSSVHKGEVDRILSHPVSLEWFPETRGLAILSKPYIYNTHSTIVLHKDSAHWLKPVNDALEVLVERNAFARIKEISSPVMSTNQEILIP